MAIFAFIPLGGNDGLRRHLERVAEDEYVETAPNRSLRNRIEAARG